MISLWPLRFLTSTAWFTFSPNIRLVPFLWFGVWCFCISMNEILLWFRFHRHQVRRYFWYYCNQRKGASLLSLKHEWGNHVPLHSEQSGNSSLALALASRGGLQGTDSLYQQQFNQLLNTGNYPNKAAAKITANSPRGILRTQETIQRLKNIQAPPGQALPIIHYLSTLLDKESLTSWVYWTCSPRFCSRTESLLLENWLSENKLWVLRGAQVTFSSLMTLPLLLAYTCALTSSSEGCHPVLLSLGEFDKILPYCQKVNYTPDYTQLLRNLVNTNPEKGAEFATQLVNQNAPGIDLERVTDVFLSQNLIQQATAFLLEALKDNLPEHAHLQSSSGS